MTLIPTPSLPVVAATAILPTPILAVLLTLLAAPSAFAQSTSLTGVLLDRDTDAPIAYAHLGVPTRNTGAIADEAGRFTLTLPSGRAEDTLIVSAIGYRTTRLVVRDLHVGATVYLAPATYSLAAATVRARTPGRPLRIGREVPSKTTSGYRGTDDLGVGAEFGALVPSPGHAYRLTAAHVHARFNTLDSLLLRVGVYRLDETGLPGAPLLTAPALATAYRKAHWLSVPLPNGGLDVGGDEDVVVTFEVVRVWRRRRGKSALFFSHAADPAAAVWYTRPHSLSAWSRSEGEGYALYVSGYALE